MEDKEKIDIKWLADNGWNVYSSQEYQKIQEEKPDMNDIRNGYVYIMEYNYKIKIGKTYQPFRRTVELLRQCAYYSDGMTGRIAISCAHENYNSNEKELHNYFCENKVLNGELFKLSFEYVLNQLVDLNMVFLPVKNIDLSSRADIIMDYFRDYNYVSQEEKRDFFKLQPKKGFIDALAEFSREKGNFHKLFSEIYNYIGRFYDLDTLWSQYMNSERIYHDPTHAVKYLYEVFWFYPDVMEKIYDYLFKYHKDMMLNEFVYYKSSFQKMVEDEINNLKREEEFKLLITNSNSNK